MQLIAVDLGNTRAKFGYFASTDDSFPVPDSTFVDIPEDFEFLRRRLDAIVAKTESPIYWRIARTGTFPWEKFQERLVLLRPDDRFVELSWTDIPMKLDVEFPEKVGIDRILAAYAVLFWRKQPENKLRYGDNLRSLVVDAGTATTVDLINPEGAFAGGAIFPGLNSTSKTLSAISPRLPRIATDELPFAVYPGKNTEEALAAGIYWGAVGAIRQFYQIVQTTLQDSRLPSRVPVFLAGGDAKHLHAGLSLFMEPELLISMPDLILSGIALLAREGARKIDEI